MVQHMLQLMLAVLLSTTAHAVTVADTITYPDGSTANGRLLIELASSTNTSALTYATFRRYVSVAAGVFTVDLAANTSLQPAGTYYKVTYQLDRSIGGSASVEFWNVPTGGPYTIRVVRWRDRNPTGFVTTMSGTVWTVPASAHGLRTRNITVRCEDLSGNAIDCAPTVNSLWTVRVPFVVAQSGRLILNAVSAWSAQNYTKAVTSVTSVVIPNSEHGLSTNRIAVQCWDSADPAAEVKCASSVNTSTYAVTVTFVVAQSGYIVLSGR